MHLKEHKNIAHWKKHASLGLKTAKYVFLHFFINFFYIPSVHTKGSSMHHTIGQGWATVALKAACSLLKNYCGLQGKQEK